MLICNQINDSCDPECPHGKPHKPILEFILEIADLYMYCDQDANCAYRDDRPMVRCVEATCPATA